MNSTLNMNVLPSDRAITPVEKNATYDTTVEDDDLVNILDINDDDDNDSNDSFSTDEGMLV